MSKFPEVRKIVDSWKKHNQIFKKCMSYKKKEYYVKSGKDKIYVELGYPKRKSYPAPAVVVAIGLRSYYPGFLNMFAKRLRDAGYISVKFHYVGTGKSSGKFEDKTTKQMFQNYDDVIAFLKTHPDISSLGVVARSNSGSLATLHGPDPDIKAYTMLAPPAYYSLTMKKFTLDAKKKGKFFYHASFKRPHTKGPGRLPLTFIGELKQYDKKLLQNIKKMKHIIFFQSTEDEAVPLSEGHFDYWKANLPQPRKIVLIEGGNHSFKGHKGYVIKESIKWFKKYL